MWDSDISLVNSTICSFDKAIHSYYYSLLKYPKSEFFKIRLRFYDISLILIYWLSQKIKTHFISDSASFSSPSFSTLSIFLFLDNLTSLSFSPSPSFLSLISSLFKSLSSALPIFVRSLVSTDSKLSSFSLSLSSSVSSSPLLLSLSSLF